jgi:hypothetical protein
MRGFGEGAPFMECMSMQDVIKFLDFLNSDEVRSYGVLYSGKYVKIQITPVIDTRTMECHHVSLRGWFGHKAELDFRDEYEGETPTFFDYVKNYMIGCYKDLQDRVAKDREEMRAND